MIVFNNCKKRKKRLRKRKKIAIDKAATGDEPGTCQVDSSLGALALRLACELSGAARKVHPRCIRHASAQVDLKVYLRGFAQSADLLSKREIWIASRRGSPPGCGLLPPC